MSLRIKFSSQSPHALHICSSCQFTTHNRPEYERHLTRCPASNLSKIPPTSKNMASSNDSGANQSYTDLPDATVFRNYQCDKCNFTSNKSRQFLFHRKIEHSENITIFGCNKCIYASKSKNKLLRHRVLVHKDTIPITDIQPLEDSSAYLYEASSSAPERKKPKKKPAVGKTSGNPDRHSLGSSPGMHASEDSVFDFISWDLAPTGGAVAVGSCTICGYSNPAKSRVFDHIKKMHFKEGKFRCHYCTFQCHTKVEWNQHMRNHSAQSRQMDRPQPVPSVNRTSVARPALNAVDLSNTSAKCGVCGLVVKTESRLKVHMITHTSTATWVCPMCPLRYKRPADLNRHMKRKHGTKLRDFREKPDGKLSPTSSDMSDDRASSFYETNTDSELDIPLNLCIKKSDSDNAEGPLDLSCKESSSPSHCGSPDNRFALSSRNQPSKSVECQFCSQNFNNIDNLNDHIRNFHRVSPSRLTKTSAPLGVLIPYNQTDTESTENAPDSEVSAANTKSGNTTEVSMSHKLQCSFCSYVGKHRSDLDRHMCFHTGRKPYQCLYCTYNTVWKHDMKRHLPKHHQSEVDKHGGNVMELLMKTYTPPTLNEMPAIVKMEPGEDSSVSSLAALVGDLESGIEENNNIQSVGPMESCYLGGSWEVREPDQSSETSSSVTHTSNTDQSKVCPICSASCPTNTRMKKHMEIHDNLKRFMCPYCGKRSNWYSDIRRHIHRGHHGKKEHVETLSREEAKRTLDDYLKVFGENTRCATKPAEDTPLKPSKNLSDLDDTSEMADVEGTPDPKRFECSFCHRKSKWRWNLKKHIEQMHPRAEIVDLKTAPNKNTVTCSVCNYTCHLKSQLNKHMEIHKNLKRYQCIHCGKRSNWKADVRKHIQDHHPHKKVEVRTLSSEEAIRTLSSYMSSMGGRSKRKEVIKSKSMQYRRFKCSKCPKRSNWRWQLVRHVKKAHSWAKVIDLGVEVAKATFQDAFSAPRSRPSPEEVKALQSGREQEVPETEDTKQSGQTIYKCGRCGHGALDRRHLNLHLIPGRPCHGAEIHVIKESDSQRFSCSLCSFVSDNKAGLINHKKWKHSYKELRAQLYRNKNEAPQDDKSQAEVETGDDQWEDVRESFGHSKDTSDFSGKKKKKKKNSGDSKLLYKYRQNSPKNVFRFRKLKCSECGKRSNWRWNLKSHISTAHPWAQIIELSEDEARATFSEAIQSTKGPNGKAKLVLQSLQEPPNENTAVKQEPVEDKGENQKGNPVRKTMSNFTPWKCLDCDYTATKMMVIDHMRTNHPNSVKYTCKICGFTCAFRASAYRHVKHRHKQTMVSQYITQPQIVQCPPTEQEKQEKQPTPPISTDTESHTRSTSESSSKLDDSEEITSVLPQGRFKCCFCPFQTNNIKVLNYHKRHHKPRLGKKSSCRYCPYYVISPHLVSQHRRLHRENQSEGSSDNQKKAFPGSGPLKGKTKGTIHCKLCPFISNYPSRYSYHMRLHERRPGNDLKCPHCFYWCCQLHSLKNHLKVHTEHYISTFRPDLVPPEPEPLMPILTKIETSPCKSDISDGSADDQVETAGIKQKIIASKTASVVVTPTKLDRASDPPSFGREAYMHTPVLDEQGQVISLGQYRKQHKCSHCPYTNVRLTSLLLHEKMHIPRESTDDQPIYKCQYCSYNAGNKGLLAIHVRVHTEQYSQTQEEINDVEAEESSEPVENQPSEENNKKEDSDENESPFKEPKTVDFPQKPTIKPDYPTMYDFKKLPEKADFFVKYKEESKEHVLEKVACKRWGCERCPYGTLKKSQFEKHVMLHGSAQKYTCQFCDYSVPGYHLLLQHQRLHLSPNPNLLCAQSINHLHRLPIIPADIDAAAPEKSQMPKVNHDDQDLYENSEEFTQPTKMFRCDRCPYVNPRRDQLLFHLKFHMISSELKCQFCDYSVSKVHLLNQHTKVHFNTPGSEMNCLKRSLEDEYDMTPDPKKNRCLTEEEKKEEFISALQLQKIKDDDVTLVETEKSPDDKLSPMDCSVSDEITLQITVKKPKENMPEVNKTESPSALNLVLDGNMNESRKGDKTVAEIDMDHSTLC